MLVADDRDGRRMLRWLVFPVSFVRVFFFLPIGRHLFGGCATVCHGMYVRWNDLSMATHVYDNDHEFPVI